MPTKGTSNWHGTEAVVTEACMCHMAELWLLSFLRNQNMQTASKVCRGQTTRMDSNSTNWVNRFLV